MIKSDVLTFNIQKYTTISWEKVVWLDQRPYMSATILCITLLPRVLCNLENVGLYCDKPLETVQPLLDWEFSCVGKTKLLTKHTNDLTDHRETVFVDLLHRSNITLEAVLLYFKCIKAVLLLCTTAPPLAWYCFNTLQYENHQRSQQWPKSLVSTLKMITRVVCYMSYAYVCLLQPFLKISFCTGNLDGLFIITMMKP